MTNDQNRLCRDIGLIILSTVFALVPIFVFITNWSTNASISNLEYWRTTTMYYHHLFLLICICGMLLSTLFRKYYLIILILSACIGYIGGLMFAISNSI